MTQLAADQSRKATNLMKEVDHRIVLANQTVTELTRSMDDICASTVKVLIDECRLGGQAQEHCNGAGRHCPVSS